jgi:hypothetical protein
VHVLWLYPNSVIYSLASGLERRRDVVLPRQVKQVLLDGRGQWLHEATSFAHVLGRVEQTVAFVRLFSHDVLRIHSTHVARLPFREEAALTTPGHTPVGTIPRSGGIHPPAFASCPSLEP